MRKFILRTLGLLFCFFVLMLAIASFLPEQSHQAQASMPQPMTKLDPHEDAMKTTTIAKYHGHKDDSGMILYETFTIRNNGDAAVKDLTIKCDNGAPSGTVIDSNTRTIYQIVPAHKSRTFSNFNMGFIHPQATSSGCEIEDLALVQ
ncbi:MAG TPA: hypothetical protein VGM92_01045 [Candidatus Kapabacteria bacterium]